MIECKWVRSWLAAGVLIVGTGFWQKAAAFVPGACSEDAEKVCPGVADKDVIPCLKEHPDGISTTCKTNLAETRDAMRDVKDTCKDEVQKFCADVKPGGGRILRCLHKHQSELSPDCQSTVGAVKKKF